MKNGDPLVHGSEAEQWGGWDWRDPERGQHFRTCSYCGSMHPDDLAAELALGATVGWADWKYGWPHKVYVEGVTNRDPGATFYVGSTHGGDPAREVDPKYVHVSKLTPEQRAILIRDGALREDDPTGPEAAAWFEFGTRETHFAKFYSVHLADPEVGPETQAAIARASRLIITFADGKVLWRPVEVGGDGG